MMTEAAMLELIRARCVPRGGASKLAAQAGVSKVLIHHIVTGAQGVGAKVPEALGFKRVVSFYEKGACNERQGD